jgi:hypothetical protein
MCLGVFTMIGKENKELRPIMDVLNLKGDELGLKQPH